MLTQKNSISEIYPGKMENRLLEMGNLNFEYFFLFKKKYLNNRFATADGMAKIASIMSQGGGNDEYRILS